MNDECAVNLLILKFAAYNSKIIHMIKQILFVRHAKTEIQEFGQLDFDRKLKPRGHNDTKIMSKVLQDLNIKPDKIYSSPAKRTTQTTEILTQNLDISTNQVIFEETIYEAGLGDLLHIINNFDNHNKLNFMVGHNPSITYIADWLANSNMGFMPTCGMALVEFNLENWEEVSQNTGSLIWFKTPKLEKEE